MEFFKQVYNITLRNFGNKKGNELEQIKFVPKNESQLWTTTIEDIKSYLKKYKESTQDYTDLFIILMVDQPRSQKGHLHSYGSEGLSIRNYLEDKYDFDHAEHSAFPSNRTYNRDFILDEPYIKAIYLTFNPFVNAVGTFEGNTCLAQALSRFMPDINFPDAYIRKILKIPHSILIPITSENISILEKELKLSISVVGDFEYISTCRGKREVKLKLENNHIELLNKKPVFWNFNDSGVSEVVATRKINFFPKKERYCIYTHIEDLFHVHYGFGTHEILYEDFIKLRNDYNCIPLDTVQTSFCSSKVIVSLEEAYEIMKKLNDSVKLPGKYKMVKYKTMSALALDIYFTFFMSGKKCLNNLTHITETEEMFISRCPGPISYNITQKKANLVTYDFNRLYPFIMSREKYNRGKRLDGLPIPLGEPEFKTLETFFDSNSKVCIYKCTVDTSGVDEKYKMLIRLSRRKYRSSEVKFLVASDVEFLKILGARVELVKNGFPNCLYYNKISSMHTLFSEYIEHFLKLRDESNSEYEKNFYKKMANILWGSICGFNKINKKIKITINDVATPVVSGETATATATATLEAGVPLGAGIPPAKFIDIFLLEENKFKISLLDTVQPYIYPLARIKPFLFAYARIKICKDIINSDSIEKCKRIHVDGVSFTERVKYYDERLGKEPGKYKEE